MIITDFLEYARVKATHTEHIELLPMLDETIMLLKNSKDIAEHIRISRNVDPYISVKGDAQRLRQVFWNLLLNACQAMPTGGEIIVSALPCPQTNGKPALCEIIITDTGPGIAHEFLEKIFDPFFTTKRRGTGLGLAIVYRIVEDHGGTITVDSKPGKGAQFTIRLPMIESALKPSTLNSTVHSESSQ
jgi:signal transduction histidine kinase